MARTRQCFLARCHSGVSGHEAANRDGIKQICSNASSKFDGSRHIVATHQVVIQGETATSRCYLHAQHIRKHAVGGPHYVVAGRYEDNFVRTPQGWRIKNRTLAGMWTEGNVAVVRG